MPRFSSKARKVFDLIMYKTDIESANSMLSELTTPVDINSAKLWIANYYLVFYQRDVFLKIIKEVEENIRLNPDNYFQYYITNFYFFYYSGFNSPSINKLYFLNIYFILKGK